MSETVLREHVAEALPLGQCSRRIARDFKEHRKFLMQEIIFRLLFDELEKCLAGCARDLRVHLGAQASYSRFQPMLAAVVVRLSAQRRRLNSFEHEMNNLGAVPG